ncbi:aldo/keto reductase [Thermoproteota archaeon]
MRAHKKNILNILEVVILIYLNKICLGKSNLLVSRLCFGTEPFTIVKGPIGKKSQGDRSPQEAGEILKKAFRKGINFWDTSVDYLSHSHVAEGLKKVNRKDVIITDKSHAMTYEEGENAIDLSLNELGTDYLDIMMLHNVPLKTHWVKTKMVIETVPLQKRMGALKAFSDAKDSGKVKALGLSTHSTQVLKQTLEVPEIDVVLTVLNKNGSLIEDGSLSEHIEMIKNVRDSGKGIYVCKVIDAGKLRIEGESAIKFVLQYQSFIHAFNIGMYSIEDVIKNISLFEEVLGN